MNKLYTKFNDDLEKYLASKLPDLPTNVAMEIGEYISNRVSRLVVDAYNQHEKRIHKLEKRDVVKRYRELTEKLKNEQFTDMRGD